MEALSWMSFAQHLPASAQNICSVLVLCNCTSSSTDLNIDLFVGWVLSEPKHINWSGKEVLAPALSALTPDV